MQRKRPPPAQRQIWTILLILALLVLFVLTVGTSCTANPHLYSGRGAGGVPACFHNAQQHPGAVLEQFRTVKYSFCVLNQNFFKKRADNQI